MSSPPSCDGCLANVRTRRVQARVVFGIHAGKKPVWEKKVRNWCGRCRSVNDGRWRSAR